MYKKAFAVSAIFGLITVGIILYAYNTLASFTPVVRAQTDIQADEIATNQNITTDKTMSGAVQSDTVLNPQELQGMAAKGFIPSGTVLRKAMFQKISDAGIAAKLSTMGDKVAIALPADTINTVGGNLKQDQEIVVKSTAKSTTRTLASKAIVLSAPKNKTSGSVVLAVSPNESDMIFNARGNNEQIVVELLPPRIKG